MIQPTVPCRITPSTSSYRLLSPGLSVQLHEISHGSISHKTYTSTAFFVRNDLTSSEFLFFGDVEPDSISRQPRTRAVWSAAAERIVMKRGCLEWIFLECSYREGRRKEELFGHLSPEYVVEEMKALAREVVWLKMRLGSSPATPTTNGGHSPIANGNGNGIGVGVPGGGGGMFAAAMNFTRRRRISSAIRRPSLPVVPSSFSFLPSPSSPSSSEPLSRSTTTTQPPLRDAQLINALSGLTLMIIHCKDPMPPDAPVDDIRAVIKGQVEALLEPLKLGIRVEAAEQGKRYCRFTFA